MEITSFIAGVSGGFVVKSFDLIAAHFRRQVATRRGVQAILHDLNVNLDLMRLAGVGRPNADPETLVLCAQFLVTDSLKDPFHEAKRGEDSILKLLNTIQFVMEDDGSEGVQVGLTHNTAIQSVVYLKNKIDVLKILATSQCALLRANARLGVRLTNIQRCSSGLASLLSNQV
jgi:hypothetical protein